MKARSYKKYSGIALAIGAIVLVVSIICFVVLGINLGNLEENLGYKPSASEAKEMLEQAEGMAQMLGGDISDLLGVSGFQVFLIKFSMAMRIPLLIVGILLVGAGVALRFINTNSKAMDRAKAGIAHGVSGASAVLKETIDKATSKCPKCGKVCSAKTAFCPSCGEKMIKPKPVVRPAKTSTKTTFLCPNCKKAYSEKVAFCPACGQKMPDEKPVEAHCRNCGAVNASGAKFCSTCGTDLGAVVSDDMFTPMTAYPETKEDIESATEKETPARIVHTRTHDDVVKPSVTVVTEKKNPFMNKPNKL